MDNHAIAALLMELSTGLEFLGEPFKARAYRKASETIGSLELPVRDFVANRKIIQLAGIGKSIAALLDAWLMQCDFSALHEMRAMLPAGLAELLNVPGLGMKKIKLLHSMGISTLEDLLAALETGRLSGVKGFTENHITRMQRAIMDIIDYRGRFLLDRALRQGSSILDMLMAEGLKAESTGQCRRVSETISSIDILVLDTSSAMETIQRVLGLPDKTEPDTLTFLPQNSPSVHVHLTSEKAFVTNLFLTTGSDAHTLAVKEIARECSLTISKDGLSGAGKHIPLKDEDELYARLGMAYIPPELRELGNKEIALAIRHALPSLIRESDVIGTLHIHTTYSDGKSTLKELFQVAQGLGYAWIGISDHSLSARYARGMQVKTVKQQHEEIDRLNREGDITVLKGIECDIQPDGSLDYPEEVLASFDFVIASVHTQMNIERKAMTERIRIAIRNPMTSILGHPTGRLLLSREGYAVDMDAVLDEALKNHVAIELNAHPWRLDLDWTLIDSFASSGGMIAIGPDAHETQGLSDMRYGILIARKGFLTPERCLNTFDADTVRGGLKRCR